jgi:ATP/maltotriose-dependent transcriptional regulator MalT
LSNQEIGAALHLTEHTLKNQFGPLYAKLGVHDRTQAVLTAMAMDLAPRPKPPPRTDW